jgi:hypothetical protein
MAILIVLVVVGVLVCAAAMDRRARKHGSTTVPSSQLSRRIRETHRLARDRETFRGNLPGADWAEHREGQGGDRSAD